MIKVYAHRDSPLLKYHLKKAPNVGLLQRIKLCMKLSSEYRRAELRRAEASLYLNELRELIRTMFQSLRMYLLIRRVALLRSAIFVVQYIRRSPEVFE